MCIFCGTDSQGVVAENIFWLSSTTDYNWLNVFYIIRYLHITYYHHRWWFWQVWYKYIFCSEHLWLAEKGQPIWSWDWQRRRQLAQHLPTIPPSGGSPKSFPELLIWRLLRFRACSASARLLPLRLRGCLPVGPSACALARQSTPTTHRRTSRHRSPWRFILPCSTSHTHFVRRHSMWSVDQVCSFVSNQPWNSRNWNFPRQ